jgi:Fe-S-cluster containining protein
MKQMLSRPYASRYGLPVIDAFDPRIFDFTYYHHCMECRFCQDSCCQYGADVEAIRIPKVMEHAAELEQYLGVPRSDWFRDSPDDLGMIPDSDYPGEAYTRTQVVDLPPGRSPHNQEACVFLDPSDRGCRLHRFALERGLDVHDVKPMVCLLFPITFNERMISPALEFFHEDLVCLGAGPTVYQSAREDLRYYFGDAMVEELDRLEAEYRATAAPNPRALPMVA